MYIKMLVRGNILLRFRLVQKGAVKKGAIKKGAIKKGAIKNVATVHPLSNSHLI